MFDYSKVKDPQYYKENRLPQRSDHIWYADREEKEAGKSSFLYSLNGLWKFSCAPNYHSVIQGFETMEYDCRSWADIRVPAHIQMEGWDVPQYANVQYPWDGREEIEPGQIPERFNPTACYVKYFNIPEQMKKGPLYISFQGVESAVALWCNGHFVGYSEDSFTPAEFELTDYVTSEGENKLAAMVFKWCAGSWCEDQDFFRFSGIFRDVYLYTEPGVHIRDMKISTELGDDFGEAVLSLELTATAQGRIKASLLWNGGCVQRLEGRLEQSTVYSVKVTNPRLWSAEMPSLYELILEVFDREGNLTEVISEKVGFRRFELADGLMKLNGKRIVFKGVNRHEFSPRSGRVVSQEELKKDLATMKRSNINAVRTCHYPNDSRFYRLCDELGLYVIDECNLETHGSWDAYFKGLTDIDSIIPGNRPEWRDMLLDRAASMYLRDKNHPCILIWSCGNESFGGKTIYEMSEYFRSVDKSRLVHYEGIYNDRRFPETSDMESQMYTPAVEIAEFLKNNRSKPFICCEYVHAMGNSCGAMHKYTELAETEPLYQGGFIWDYIDQSVTKKDRYGREFQAYGGDFGDRPCDFNFSGNGIACGENREPSPKMQEVKFNYQNIGIEVEETCFRVVNRNLFINTDCFDCVVLLEKEGRQIGRERLQVNVAPGERGSFPLPVRLPAAPGEYTVTVSFRLREDTLWAEAGHETAFGQGVFTRTEGIIADGPVAVKGALEVAHGAINLGVRGREFEVLFSHLFGGLVSYRYGGKELLKAIPRPNFWRAPIDNDCGNDMMCRYGQWKLASMYCTHHGAGEKNPVVTEEDGCVTVAYTYLLPTVPAVYCVLSYKVYGDGTIETTLSYEPVKELGDMPEFGVMFKIDADYDCVEWYGNGPEETYSDRKKGARLGIYRKSVAENLSPYLIPQECGNKTDVRYAKVTDRLGRGLLFAGDKMNFSALPYTPHELENAAHSYELPEVHYTVIRAALGQMGVGGDNSWGARTHEEYLLDVSKKMDFTFYFKGI